ncbi:MAG TPA: ATP-binding protein, partial [Longimicrobiaceae bacterium]|nr:ATP-binding protein [Longimicrobiaceae bacterium]
QLHRVRDEGVVREFSAPNSAGGAGACFLVHAAPVEGEGIAVHFRDSTEERKLNERYSRLIESIQDGFVAVDPEWKIVYLNRIAEQLLRLPRQRAIGHGLWTLLPPQSTEIAGAMRGAMHDSHPRRLQGITPEGEVFAGRRFDLWIHPLPGGGISMLFDDVTEHLEREKDLARLAAEAQEASRAKSRFFAAVSHELRTPLNAIVGYTYLLSSAAYGPMPAEAQRAADRIGICAEHLTRLVEDIIVVTMAEVGRLPVVPTPVRLGGFLADALQPLRYQAEAKGLRFAVEVAEPNLSLETDPDRLRQLLLALLSNAVKFTSQGEVRIEARAVPPSASDEATHGGTDSGMTAVEIAVLDTGPGIAPEDREVIFGAFEQLGDPARTDSMQRGTGLGLTIARQLASVLRGKLWVEARPEGGSAFRLRLPADLGIEAA